MITVLVPGILALAWLIDRADARHVADRAKHRTHELKKQANGGESS